jgi:hypothetical protein
MQAETLDGYAEARRAYEVGRLRSGTWKALLVAGLVALLGELTVGSAALWVLPVTLACWLFAFWRGDVFLRGAFFGLLGGVVTHLLPLSVLRPCCKMEAMMAGGQCCTMPGACLLAGAGVGVALAALVPFGRASWWRSALGVTTGLLSIAVLRCATLFTGEAVGLLGGLLAGVLLASAARSRLAAAS